MNWLAHAFLSTSDAEFRLGNLLADLVKGRDRAAMSPAFLAGVRHHQRIDAFTDSHPVVHRSRARIGEGYRHLTGILVDVFYDHYLAIDWQTYSPEPLDSFTAHVYADIRAFSVQMPAEARFALDRMVQDDRLGSYRSIDGIAATLERVSLRLLQRTGKDFHLERAVSELTANYDSLHADFSEFFPLLRAYVCGTVEEV
ncbi:MAG TPA: ACP phosphodiesterase [Gemmataceae bacterium]|nr:ACP phosphodiesterase [Gemmataceae bacterium]